MTDLVKKDYKDHPDVLAFIDELNGVVRKHYQGEPDLEARDVLRVLAQATGMIVADILFLDPGHEDIVQAELNANLQFGQRHRQAGLELGAQRAGLSRDGRFQ